MLLYHGTSATAGAAIDKEGLLPPSSGVHNRTQQVVKHAMLHGMPMGLDVEAMPGAHPEAVYLTHTEAARYGACALVAAPDPQAATAAGICIVEVETNRLAPGRFVPDEDWLLQKASLQMLERGATGAQVFAEWPRLRREILASLPSCASAWRRCLQESGTCAYLGAIPRAAITRLIYPDMKALQPYCALGLKRDAELQERSAADVARGVETPGILRKLEQRRFYWRAVQYSLTCAQGESAKGDPFFFEWPSLWHAAMSRFALNLSSIHGAAHWATVEEAGLYLASQSGADVEIVRLFAVIHDAARASEGHDPQHGHRAAKLAREWRRKYFAGLSAERLEVLCEALKYHADGKTTEDPTIGTCWDADRLQQGPNKYLRQRSTMTAAQLSEQIEAKRTRRAKLSGELEQARASLARANGALIEGKGTTEDATAAKSRVMVLEDAVGSLSFDLSELQERLAEAQAREERDTAREELETAIDRLESVSQEVEDGLRKYLEESFLPQMARAQEAARAVSQAEKQLVRLGLRRIELPSAVEYSRPYSLLRGLDGTLRTFAQRRPLAAVDVPELAATRERVEQRRDLARAGIE